MPVPVRAIDRLRKAANLEPAKKVVDLSDGSTFEMWVSPLTMAERERAQKQAKSDDANAFALQLLLTKALDENGAKLFSPGEIDVLKNEVKDKDLQGLMLAILTDDAEPIDPKNEPRSFARTTGSCSNSASPKSWASALPKSERR
jgi:hypothetical protein